MTSNSQWAFQRAGRNRILILLQKREKWSKTAPKMTRNRIQATGRTRSADGFAPRKQELLQLWEQRGGTQEFQSENHKFRDFFFNGRKEKNVHFFFHMVDVSWYNLSLWEFQVWDLPFPAQAVNKKRLIIFPLYFGTLRPRVLLAASW